MESNFINFNVFNKKLYEVDMNVKSLILLVSIPLFISSCSTNNALATGDDLVGNELCGTMVDSGSDPCEYLREINLYSAVRHEEYNNATKNSYTKIDEILKNWVIENSDKFSRKNINIYHKSKRAPLNKGYGPENIINIYFWSVEIKDKKC